MISGKCAVSLFTAYSVAVMTTYIWQALYKTINQVFVIL